MLGKGKTFKTMISFMGPCTDQGKELMNMAVKAGVNLLAVDAILVSPALKAWTFLVRKPRLLDSVPSSKPPVSTNYS